MGSTARGLITGFICRLCSKMNRYVILIYGEEGQRMNLAEKINSYLPITVNRNDPLPKTVCLNCIEKLETQHRMVARIKEADKKFQEQIQQNGFQDSSSSSGTSDTSTTSSDSELDEPTRTCGRAGCDVAVNPGAT